MSRTIFFSFRHRPSAVVLSIGVVLLSGSALAVAAISERSGPRLKDGGSGSPLPSLTLAVDDGMVVPGDSGNVLVRSLGALPLSRGRLTITMQPPIFIDNPVLGFGSTTQIGSFVVASPAAGTYVVDLNGSSAPFNTEAGVLVVLSGTVRQDLSVGGTVDVFLEAEAVSATGRTARARCKGGRLSVVSDDASLVLRIDSTEDLVPGATVELVIRTYNPKPISQGQVDLAFDRRVFRTVDAVTVQGAEPDVSYRADLGTPGLILLSFSSPSASINRLDGAMITLRMTLDATLQPGDQTWLTIDLPNTFLLDQDGRPVALATRGGQFTIEEPH